MDTRAKLLAAARTRFTSRGFTATSMDDIRRDAGVSNGSLFHHFRTKNHVARALYLETIAAHQAMLAREVAEATGAADAIARMVEGHIAWVLAHREDARILVELRGETTIDGEEVSWDRVNAEAFGRLRAFLAAGIAKGELLDLPLDAWMALVFGPVLQLTRRWTREPDRAVPKEVRAALVRAAVLAVTPAPTMEVSPRVASPPPPADRAEPARVASPSPKVPRKKRKPR